MDMSVVRSLLLITIIIPIIGGLPKIEESIIVLADSKWQRLGDYLANTQVVKVSELYGQGLKR